VEPLGKTLRDYRDPSILVIGGQSAVVLSARDHRAIPVTAGAWPPRPHNRPVYITSKMFCGTFSGTRTFKTPPKKLQAASQPAITSPKR
jgi:hypothetical protein